MRLEVTVCHSIFETCLDNLSHIGRGNKGRQLLDELYKRRLVLHTDLEQEYITYFENHRPDLLDIFLGLYSELIVQADNAVMVPTYKKELSLCNNYLDIIVNICKSSLDKILLTEKGEEEISSLAEYGINTLNSDEIIDKNASNILNIYRLPIIRKVISNGESSIVLSKWLSKFLSSESEFTVVDNYIYQNSNQFLNYFLKYIKHESVIYLYTLLPNRMSENDLKSFFENAPYDKWSFNIHLIENKKVQHARDILTNNYYIEIDKGMRVFGVNGLTEQANITISHKEDIHSDILPRAKQLI